MSDLTSKTALITGANAGIGKEVAKQLGTLPEFGRIILACRSRERAAIAKSELEKATGRSIFEIAQMDVADLNSVHRGVASLTGKVDALIMNAGVIGGKKMMTLTASGVTELFATNVLGHVVLLDELISQNRLGEVAVLVGSEAARGIPKTGLFGKMLNMNQPSFTSTSVEELCTVMDGSFFDGKKFEPNLAFGQVKYIGALWMAHMARKNPGLRLITVSPGNTTGTAAPDGLALPLRFVAKHVMPHMGLSHDLGTGAKRLVDAVTNSALSTGVFYASTAGKLKGPLVDQAIEIFPDLANHSFQDHANEAIHRFIV